MKKLVLKYFGEIILDYWFLLGFRSRMFFVNTLSGGSTFDMVGGWARAGAGWFVGYHNTFHFRGTKGG